MNKGKTAIGLLPDGNGKCLKRIFGHNISFIHRFTSWLTVEVEFFDLLTLTAIDGFRKLESVRAFMRGRICFPSYWISTHAVPFRVNERIAYCGLYPLCGIELNRYAGLQRYIPYPSLPWYAKIWWKYFVFLNDNWDGKAGEIRWVVGTKAVRSNSETNYHCIKAGRTLEIQWCRSQLRIRSKLRWADHLFLDENQFWETQISSD